MFRFAWIRFSRLILSLEMGAPRREVCAGEIAPEPVYLLQVPGFASRSCQEKSPRTDVGSSCIWRRGSEIQAGTRHFISVQEAATLVEK